MESYGTNPTQKKDDMYGAHGTTGGGHQAHGVAGDQVTTGGVGHVTGGVPAGHVTGGVPAGHVTGGGQEQMMRPEKEEHGGGILHRSGSSGSSSSEDDGMGGRRKKGLKEKIKEKLPGHDRKTDEHVQEHGTAAATTGARGRAATTATAGHEETAEKKGMMEKIKEKLPGANR